MSIDTKALLERLGRVNKTDLDDEFIEQIRSWERQVGELDALSELSQNFIVQDFIKRYQGKIEVIDAVLKEREDLPDIDRRLMIREKSMYRDFISKFSPDGRLEVIAKEIDENLTA